MIGGQFSGKQLSGGQLSREIIRVVVVLGQLSGGNCLVTDF